ncbi:hypothetical protein PR048_028614 [Dryococelus australis]|uniref:Uncharacterized protein n=1 Tax=Dryococelus australis TaxID=614101 RepID=A0ABQ9GDQ6_9NEOP|nr:hypothetical protein PR048_028614 [Dryococelus australis]
MILVNVYLALQVKYKRVNHEYDEKFKLSASNAEDSDWSETESQKPDDVVFHDETPGKTKMEVNVAQMVDSETE